MKNSIAVLLTLLCPCASVFCDDETDTGRVAAYSNTKGGTPPRIDQLVGKWIGTADEENRWVVTFSPAGIFDMVVVDPKKPQRVKMQVVGTYKVDNSFSPTHLDLEAIRKQPKKPKNDMYELDVTPTAIGFSGDSKLLAVADSKSVTIWNTTDGRRMRELKDYTVPVTGVALLPNGKLLATVGCTMTRPGDLELKLWDLESGKEIRSIYEKDHRGKMDAANPNPFVVFSPEGRLIAFPTKDRHVSVRNVSDWSELQSLNIANVPSVGAFSPDRKILAIGTHNHGWALLYDLESGKRIRIVSSITASPNLQVSFSDDGQLIYAVYGGYVFRQDTQATDSGHPDKDTIWAMHNSKLPRMKRPFAWSYSVTNHLLALQHADSLELYDTDTQTTRATIADAKGLALFSPDGKLLVISNGSGKTVLRAIPTK